MAGPPWPPSRVWQYWAIAGMIVLTAAFWWTIENHNMFAGMRPHDQITDGLLRFSILILTPALLLVWLCAAWFRRRVGEPGYWKLLSLVALIWVGVAVVTRILLT